MSTMEIPLTGVGLQPRKKFGLLDFLRAQIVANSTSGCSVPSNAPLSLLADAALTSVWVGDLATIETAPEILGEIKDRSGLTWDQIARAMGVNRRSVHNWLSERPMSAEKEENLHTLALVVRTLAGSSQRQTRSRMLDRTGGESVFERFIAGRRAEALELAHSRALSSHSPMLSSGGWRRISEEARDARRSPITPLDLLETSVVVGAPPAKLKRARRMTRRTDGD
jgi:hypothetical protein